MNRAGRSRLTWATVLAALLPLGACGGGGVGSDGGTPPLPPNTGDATSLAPRSTFTDADVRHLLVRTHFGVNEVERQAVHQVGVPAYVDAMVQFAPLGSTPVEQQAEAFLVDVDDPNGFFPSDTDLARWWQYIMQRTTTPFQEVLALFWHDHFATSSAVFEGDQLWWFKGHVNLLRGYGNTNLRGLLVGVARDWAMLRWLDGIISTDDDPNENFGREFWELFTLGVDDGYTQADILEAARAFTGYRQRFDPVTQRSFVEFDARRHDGGSKTVLGVTIPAQDATDDYQAVVNITLDNRPAAEFICRKILAHFCYLDPPPVLVSALAQLLRDSNYEIAPVLAVLFKSEAFYSDASKAGLVKSPVEHAVGFIRSTGLVIDAEGRRLDEALVAMGQRPTQPPTVNGWNTGTLWLSAQGMVGRANLVQRSISARTYQASIGVDVAPLLPSPQATAAETVDALAALLRVTYTPAERTTWTTYLDTDFVGGQVVASPFSASNATHLSQRVRGLLYVLAQHPSYSVR